MQGYCPYADSSQKRWTLASYEETPLSNTLYGGGLYASEVNLMKTLSNQPAVIYLEANSDFQFYSYGEPAVLMLIDLSEWHAYPSAVMYMWSWQAELQDVRQCKPLLSPRAHDAVLQVYLATQTRALHAPTLPSIML